MLFSSNVFLFAFLPAVLVMYYISPRILRNPVLLLFSLFFYGWGEPVYLFLMIGDILLNYICGRQIAAARERGGSGRAALTVGVVLNLMLLGYFKYANFFFGDLIPPVALPIGISFYIFQSMSYIIDVYRNDAPMQRNVLTFGTYVTLFPQLIAGPIVRYLDVARQLEAREENVRQFASGVLLFICGLAKKVLLANPAGQFWVLMQAQEGTLAAWMGLMAYGLQMYFDFSGYSDMAIGLGRMLGFEFLKNFDHPYTAPSITEYWHRWHISLSTWFKEYVYIPLGGSRKGKPRQILNIAIVWLLTGLWHGASWNYVLWGGYYALLLIAEKLFLLKCLDSLPKAAGRLYAMGMVYLGWTLFYFEDLSAMAAFWERMFTAVSSAGCMYLIWGFLPFLLAACLACTPIPKRLYGRLPDGPAKQYGLMLAAGLVFLLCVAALASQSYNPFIYFRF